MPKATEPNTAASPDSPMPPDVETLVSDLQATIGVMRHLTCSPLQVTSDQWSVVVGRANQIADTLYEVWQCEWESEFEERKTLREELAALTLEKAAPGSEGDRKTLDAHWWLLRSVASVVMQQTATRLAEAAEPPPDNELIAVADAARSHSERRR